MCQKDFQKLEKALTAYTTYQAILLEMKSAIGVVEGVDDSIYDDSMSESDMSIGGGTESSSLSGVSKLPEGEASPSAVPDRRTAVVTLGRRKLPVQRTSGDSALIKRRRLSQQQTIFGGHRAATPVQQHKTPKSLLKVAHIAIIISYMELC